MRQKIPVSATLKDRAAGVLINCQNAGKSVSMAIYEGFKSLGYKSRFEHVRAVWLRIEVDGARPYVRSFTGSNIPEAYKEMETLKKHLGPPCSS